MFNRHRWRRLLPLLRRAVWLSQRAEWQVNRTSGSLFYIFCILSTIVRPYVTTAVVESRNENYTRKPACLPPPPTFHQDPHPPQCEITPRWNHFLFQNRQQQLYERRGLGCQLTSQIRVCFQLYDSTTFPVCGYAWVTFSLLHNYTSHYPRLFFSLLKTALFRKTPR